LRLTTSQLSAIQEILEGIESGKPIPRIAGPIGRFLLEYGSAQADVSRICAKFSIERRDDGAISGSGMGSIEIHPVEQPKITIHPYPLGEVAESRILSEELGATLKLVLWLKGPVANASYNELKNRSIALEGDFRWTPLSKITPGESVVSHVDHCLKWYEARFLKSVAEDIHRPTHALEYSYDKILGLPSLKCYRSIAVKRSDSTWFAFSTQGPTVPFRFVGARRQLDEKIEGWNMASLLVYREPWSDQFTAIDAHRIGPNEAFAHVCEWFDFQLEIQSQELDASSVLKLRRNFIASGIALSGGERINLRRSLIPIVKPIHAWLRGLN
jgi:hypothetical protein